MLEVHLRVSGAVASRRRFIAGLGAAAMAVGYGSALRGAHGGNRIATLGVLCTDDRDVSIMRGATLARDALNSAGGIAGRQVALARYAVPMTGDADEFARRLARALDEGGPRVAVIGCTHTREALDAALAHEARGLLYLNVSTADATLAQRGFERLFNLLPNNVRIGAQMADKAAGAGYGSVAILRSRDDDADQLALGFEGRAAPLGLRIALDRSFEAQAASHRALLADLAARPVDAVLLAAPVEVATALLNEAFRMDLSLAWILGNYVRLTAFARDIGVQEATISGPLLFDSLVARADVRAFRLRFRARFGEWPDGWAAQAYDAVRLVAHAAKESASCAASTLADYLRYSISWHGIAGRYSFDRAGALYSRDATFFSLQNGVIVFESADGVVRLFERA
jgi:branched-chain amino acid transport system substrate-binding protein